MIAAFEVERGANKLVGIPRATEYAKRIWDVSKVTYEKARFIQKYNIRMAQDIFATGFTEYDGQRTSMSAAYDLLRELQQQAEYTESGDPNTAIFSEAFDDFIRNQSKHLDVTKIKLVLETKLKEL